MNDPYQILNIPPTATDEEVKRAYRDLARKYHPDNYHDNPLADLAQEKMKEINEAYEVLSDKEKRAKYDQFGFAGVDPQLRLRRRLWSGLAQSGAHGDQPRRYLAR